MVGVAWDATVGGCPCARRAAHTGSTLSLSHTLSQKTRKHQHVRVCVCVCTCLVVPTENTAPTKQQSKKTKPSESPRTQKKEWCCTRARSQPPGAAQAAPRRRERGREYKGVLLFLRGAAAPLAVVLFFGCGTQGRLCKEERSIRKERGQLGGSMPAATAHVRARARARAHAHAHEKKNTGKLSEVVGHVRGVRVQVLCCAHRVSAALRTRQPKRRAPKKRKSSSEEGGTFFCKLLKKRGERCCLLLL